MYFTMKECAEYHTSTLKDSHHQHRPQTKLALNCSFTKTEQLQMVQAHHIGLIGEEMRLRNKITQSQGKLGPLFLAFKCTCAKRPCTTDENTISNVHRQGESNL